MKHNPAYYSMGQGFTDIEYVDLCAFILEQLASPPNSTAYTKYYIGTK